ncbi:MAG: hypothetical protein JWM12_3811 [Ilumatobacteraceae bacterium]|jgi:uncharacterized protein with GYD domain|nr:hypothetical protein [Ilumatobacteraceae bacterium]
MALALVLGKLSPEATKGLLQEGLAAREKYFRDLAEPSGVTVRGYYFAEGGEWDVVVLVETPEGAEAQAVASTFSVQSTGMYTSYRILRLFAPAEVDAALADTIQLRRPGS